MKRVDLAALAVEASSGTPVVVLREHDAPHRLLTIVVGGAEATSIALAASGQRAPRPLAHDLMATLVGSLDGAIDAAEITELSDGAFLASLALHGPTGEQRLDTRPSDAIALAVRVGAPLYVSEAVLDEAGTLPPADQPDQPDQPDRPDHPEIDPAEIEAAVDELRRFLDEVEPADFAVPDESDSSDSSGESDDHGHGRS